MLPQASRLRAADGGGDGAVDRLSDLPEELLHQILGGLGSAPDAVRTSVLSRRWRGLWTALPGLVFHGLNPGAVETALAQVTRRLSLNLLDVHWDDDAAIVLQRQSLSSILRAAARLAPRKLVVSTGRDTSTTGSGAVDLPCLDRTVSLKIYMWETPLALPPSGEFAALRKLALHRCGVDTTALLPLCPRLHVLVLDNCSGRDLEFDDVVIHSPSLEELVVTHSYMERIDIVAPLLKKVKMKLYLREPVTVSLSTPEVQYSKWRFITDDTDFNVTFGLWSLVTVCQRTVGERPACVNIQVAAYLDTVDDHDWEFSQIIAQLPVLNFSVLGLDIQADGHVFGPLVLHLLRIQPAIQRLHMFVEQPEKEVACPVNCLCEQSSVDWRSESVGLTNLEVVKIVGLNARDHEVDFLKLLFRCATALKKMIVRLADDVSSSESAYGKIHTLFKEYPNVKCFIFPANVTRRQKQ